MTTSDLHGPPRPIVRSHSVRKFGVLRVATTGLLLGVSWGVAARAWMRLISTSPEFSWSGSLLIITVASVSGMVLGGAAGGRRGRHPRLARTVGAFGVVPLGIGAGAILLPTVVITTFALPGTIPRRTVRIAVALLPLMAIVVVGPEQGAILATGLASLALGIAGWFPRAFRPTMAVFAIATIGAVVVPLFTVTLPIWRAVLGTAGYLLLLAPLVMAYRYVLCVSVATKAPSTSVDGDITTKESR